MRRFGIIMSSIIIMIAILFLSISFSIKDSLISNLPKDTTYKVVSTEVISLIENNLDNLTNDEKELIRKEIENNKDIDTIVTKYLKNAFEDVSKEEYNIPNVKKEISSVTDSCLNVLENSRGKKIPNEIKESVKSKFTDDENISTVYKNSINSIKNSDNSSLNEMISLYKFTTNKDVRIGFCLISLFFVLLMLILSKPKYSFLFNSGVTILLPGMGIIFGLVPLLEKTINSLKYKIDIKDFISNISDISHYLILISIIFICLYFVIKMIIKNKK